MLNYPAQVSLSLFCCFEFKTCSTVDAVGDSQFSPVSFHNSFDNDQPEAGATNS